MDDLTLQRIERAASDEELLGLLRRYLAELPHDAASRLPTGCLPADLRDTEDVADWALRLTRSRIASRDDNTLLTHLEQVFARACVRVSELLDRTGKWRRRARMGPPGEGESDNQ